MEKTEKFKLPKDPAYTGGRDLPFPVTEIFLSPDPSENRENRTMPKSRMNEIFWQVVTHKIGGIVPSHVVNETKKYLKKIMQNDF